MKRIARCAVLLGLVAPLAVQAQTPGPLVTAMQASLTRFAKNMPGAGDLMPAEKFSFKPTPEQMSFGEIMAHEAQSNESLCSALAGSPATPSETAAGATAPKDQLVARLRKSFETCGTVLAGLNETTLGDSVAFFGGRKATKARAIVALAQDWADHYAQAAMYLRANGILPPSAQPRKP